MEDNFSTARGWGVWQKCEPWGAAGEASPACGRSPPAVLSVPKRPKTVWGPLVYTLGFDLEEMGPVRAHMSDPS